MNWRSYYLSVEIEYDVTFDWSTDGCSNAPDSLLVLDLSDPCAEHDFLYRNAWLLIKIGLPVSRLKADNGLFKGIRAEVKKKLGFYGFITASVYYAFVRAFGGRSFNAKP